uniref:Cyclopropane-fatty-acyl-phospholipid synthase n=1 Tax=Brassica oleracea TaxID=3712 RepID=A0A3P6DX99_BRAOL|nr:unnamed protein product [Brassica oleracea]
MSYSTAVFKSDDEDLKTAQMRKINLLIDKARIEKNHEVLEIGCGWGTLAIEVVKKLDVNTLVLHYLSNSLNMQKKRLKRSWTSGSDYI